MKELFIKFSKGVVATLFGIIIACIVICAVRNCDLDESSFLLVGGFVCSLLFIIATVIGSKEENMRGGGYKYICGVAMYPFAYCIADWAKYSAG